MRVWRPALIAGHASACAGVGEAKLSANQLATAGMEQGVDDAMAREARPSAFRAPVRAFKVEAKSECKRLGSPRTLRGIASGAHIWRLITALVILAPVAAIVIARRGRDRASCARCEADVACALESRWARGMLRRCNLAPRQTGKSTDDQSDATDA